MTINRRPLRNRNSPKQAPPSPQQPRQNASNRAPNPRSTHHRDRPRKQPVKRAPQAPPAFNQRDVLLVVASDSAKPIEEVRSRFDPLSKKLPAHVTLLFSEPSAAVSEDLLKSIPFSNLPSLVNLNFSAITVIDEMYLWLVPDEEGREKLKAWNDELMKWLQNHTQEPFNPHITLGYIPRSVTPEDAMALAKNAISTPVSIRFEKILLEEFSENQISRPLDALILNG